jgi:hypothetical protein
MAAAPFAPTGPASFSITRRRRRENRMKGRIFIAALCAACMSGCQSTGQKLDTQQPQAVDTALQRLKFDMNCPSATANVLSREMVAPISMRFGVERAEYTVGVEGCGQRQTIVAVCPQDGSGCFAGGPRQ